MIKCDKCNEEDSDLTKPLATTSLDLGVKEGSDDQCGNEEKEDPSECDEDFTLPDRDFDKNPTGAAWSAAKENIALLSETFESIMGLIIKLQSEHLENVQVFSQLQQEQLQYSGWYQVLLNRATTAGALEERLRIEIRLGAQSQTKTSLIERLRNNHRVSWASTTPCGKYDLMQKFLAIHKAVEKVRGELISNSRSC